jgi:hypothetical protein
VVLLSSHPTQEELFKIQYSPTTLLTRVAHSPSARHLTPASPIASSQKIQLQTRVVLFSSHPSQKEHLKGRSSQTTWLTQAALLPSLHSRRLSFKARSSTRTKR